MSVLWIVAALVACIWLGVYLGHRSASIDEHIRRFLRDEDQR